MSEFNKKRFRCGEAFQSIEEFEATLHLPPHKIEITEDQRQIVILALAELSIARPGWVSCLEEIALTMDNETEEGRAQMFDQFRRNHSNPLAEKLSKS